MFTRTCALDGCDVQFQTDNPRKKHCSPRHSTLSRVRRYKAKHRSKGGGNGGGGGGAPEPTLFDTITPIDRDRAFTPIPVIGPKKTPESVPDEPRVPASVKSKFAFRRNRHAA